MKEVAKFYMEIYQEIDNDLGKLMKVEKDFDDILSRAQLLDGIEKVRRKYAKKVADFCKPEAKDVSIPGQNYSL